jgi:hypothetical protein
VLDSIIYNKKCVICTRHFSLTGSYDNVQKHKCMMNYQGTSKSMEAEALVEMLQRPPETHKISFCTIISDDDSEGRAKVQHVTNGGKLLEKIEEPKFLADPSHCKRVFVRAIYTLASAPMKTSRVTKGFAGHLKYCYDACVKRNHHLSAEEPSEQVYKYWNKSAIVMIAVMVPGVTTSKQRRQTRFIVRQRNIESTERQMK